MQTEQTIETTSAEQPTIVAAQPVPSIETVTAITDASAANLETIKTALRAKRTASVPASSNGKAAAKRVSAKQSKPTVAPVKPAKPTSEAREAAQRQANDDRRLARDAASAAVAEFYSGSSRPFKAASDRFSDINSNNGKSATARQAGLMLALITYGSGNLRADGTFTRGAFRVPATLVNANAKRGDTVLAQPESGCLGNMLGRTCDFVSGPTSGVGQATSVYKLRVEPALREIQATFGDKRAAAARKLLASYTKAA